VKYKTLGKTGVLVSEFCFGAMTFGGQGWWQAVGKVPQEEANDLVRLAFDQGINFFDTANVYSEGLSEQILGASFRALGIDRQQVVIATKVLGRMGPGANQMGLSRLHIADSINDSLRRLNTDHVDLLYIHGVDPLTPLEETMRGLEDAVRSGKTRYLGVSNHPAWMVTKANGHADKMGWAKFVAAQYFYSLAGREAEREIIPMSESENLALMPWSPLAGGFLSGKYSRSQPKPGNSRRESFDFPYINKERAYDIIERLVEVGKTRGVSAGQVALAWLLHKSAVTSVIIGAKTPEQLTENIASAEIRLSAEEMERLDAISALASEYPAWMVERQSQGRVQPNRPGKA
jgi:aryl-alcohol dehydrogenase-like predicted oxidoreductase